MIKIVSSLVYLFWFSVGALWIDIELGSTSIRPPQLVGILIVLVGIIYPPIRKEALKITKKYSQIALTITIFCVYLLLFTTLVTRLWLPFDIVKLFVYFAFSVVFLAMVSFLNKRKVTINFSFAGMLSIIALSITVFLYFQVSPQELYSYIRSAIATGNTSLIIHGIFGSKGIIGIENDESIRGLRHTLGISFTVLFFFISHYANSILQKTLKEKIFLLSVQGCILFIVFLVQSRSTWFALFLGIIFSYFDFTKGIRLRKGTFAPLVFGSVSILFLAISSGVINRFFSIFLSRLSESASYTGRISVAANMLNTILGFDEENISSTFRDSLSTSIPSAHNFVIDAGASSNFIGSLLALILFCLLFRIFIIKLARQDKLSIWLLCASLPFFVRLFTAGSGLPGIVEYAGLSMIFMNYHDRNTEQV